MKTTTAWCLLGAFLLTTLAAGDCLATGPKPDDPRAVSGNGPKEIGPKPDDPRSMNNGTIRAIGPKPDDPKALQGAGKVNTAGQGVLVGPNSGVNSQMK